jgi:Stage II sporulation protein M
LKTRTRAAIFLIVFVVLSAILAFSSSTVLSPSYAQSLSQSVQGIKGTVLGIFENNVQIALVEFVPGLGPAFGAYSSYDTGLAIAALAQSNPTNGLSGPELFFILLLTPIYWIEFTCYSVAVEESIALIVSFRNRDFRTSEWKWLIASIIFVVATLFISARLEVDLINSLK